MTLNDLENTMVVQMRNQQLYLVITDCLPPNASKVRFVNDWKMEISTKTYQLLRDYVHCKSKEVELKLNAPNQTESRTC